ncbi:MAG TPA: CHAT domain-containing tetratricopeptide repeat protein, partial [Candidatus Tectomicrobia bacterium]
DQALVHDNLGHLYRVSGKYTEAEKHLTQSLNLRTGRALDRQNSELIAITLTHLALVYLDQGKDYDLAERHLRQVKTLYEELQTRQQKPKYAEMAATLNNLALLYRTRGDYVVAERHLQEAQRIEQHGSGVTAADVAATTNHLAMLYHDKGDYANAEHYYLEAYKQWEQFFGKEHPQGTTARNNLAVLYHDKGDYERAGALLQQVLQQRIQLLGPQHPQVAVVFHNLAEMHRARGNIHCAEQLYTKALGIWQSMLADDHPYLSTALNNLAGVYRIQKDYAQAVAHLQKVLTRREKILGANHPDVATTLNNLAELHRLQGDYGIAERRYTRALEVKQQTRGAKHPHVATILHNLAIFSWGQGDIEQAITFMTQATEVREHHLALTLTTGSEEQKRAFALTLRGETDSVISLHTKMAPHNARARDLALTTALRRKSRILDALVESLATIRRGLDPAAQDLFAQLTTARAHLAALTLGKPATTHLEQHQAALKALEQQIDQLEADLSRRSAVFQMASRPVTIAAVQAAIPPGVTLVEFVRFNDLNTQQQTWLEPRYAVYVVPYQGEPTWMPLGDAATIDAAVGALRRVLRDSTRQDIAQHARTLDALIMQPVRSLLGSRSTILLAPDSQLHLVPFGTLVNEQKRYLVEQYSFLYLTTARDLLRLQIPMLPAQQAELILANPDFGPLDSATAPGEEVCPPNTDQASAAARAAIDFSQIRFCNLPGAEAEASALRKLLPQATVLTAARATEDALKHSMAPRIVHIATHGFFLDDMVIPPSALASRLTIVNASAVANQVLGVRVENPLLRSGLALAGFNTRRSGEDDGVLTALEVAGLNLWGTKLVVLSACDTGVGEVRNGEGVYGLRRALVLAGAETQMMSLWPVDDEGTLELMRAYYDALIAGQGRGEALRQVQLQFLTRPERQHPFFWGSFIQSGEWGNLDGRR